MMKTRRILLGIGGLAVGVLLLLSIFTWPRMFVSHGRELTGAAIHLTELKQFPRPGREGEAGAVYQLSEQDAATLGADRASLGDYPMRSALAFDGYQRVCWQPLTSIEAGPHRALAIAALRNSANNVDLENVHTLDDARELAAAITQESDVLLAGQYTMRDGVVTNYFVYVLDLKRRIIIQLSLLT